MKKYIFFTLFSLFAFATVACAQESSPNNGNGFGGLVVNQAGSRINWGDGFVSSTTEVLPMQDSLDPQRTLALAIRQGGVEARKKLLDTVMSLSLDGRSTIASTHGDDLKTMNTLRGFVQNSLLSTSMQESGAVNISASLNIRDGLSSIIIPPTIPFLSGIAPTISGKRAEGNIVQELSENAGLEDREAVVHSGIVIDARDFNPSPVLLPLIYDGHGVGVYGAFSVSREAVIKNGLVAYMTDRNSENLKNRVGKFPLTVKPVNTQGPGKCNLILSLEDGAKVRSVLKRKSVTEKCAVVILVSGRSGDSDTEHKAPLPGDLVDDSDGAAASPAMAEDDINEESLNETPAVPAQQ